MLSTIRTSVAVDESRSAASVLLRSGPYLIIAVVTVLFAVLAGFNYGGKGGFVLLDDPMVSMRFADNLVHGHGLVWNPSGVRVEGYTDLLWTLGMSGVLAVWPDRTSASLAMIVIGGLLLIAVIRLVSLLARHVSADDRRVVHLTTWGTALAFPILFWTLRGFEVGLLTLLLCGGCLLTLRVLDDPSGRAVTFLGGVLALGVLTRDDFAVPAVVMIAYVALRSERQLYRRLLPVLLLPLAAVTLHEAFRAAYYGALLPNTYTLKVTGYPVINRIGVGALGLTNALASGLYAPALLASIALSTSRGRHQSSLLLPTALVLSLGAYSVYVGGDAWEWYGFANRYLSPAIPLLVILASIGLVRCITQPLPWRRLLELTVAASVVAVVNVVFERLVYSSAQVREITTAGIAGRGFAATMAVVLIGSLLWASRGRSRPAVSVLALGLVVVLASTGSAWYRFVAGGPREQQWDYQRAQIGLLVNQTTSAHAVVAVVTAGAQIFFAQRRGIDMLGKMDAHIAGLPAHTDQAFLPGHMKWDYGYSVARLQPDVVLGLFKANSHDHRLLVQAGYRRAARGDLWIRKNTTAVNVPRLTAGWRAIMGQAAAP